MESAGDAWFISTPSGFNYFNTLYLRSRDQDDYSSFQFPTSANPHIKPEEIQKMRSEMPLLVARQEIDAEFVHSLALYSNGRISK